MAFESGDFTPTVKNTFITYSFMPSEKPVARSKSIPPYAKLCQTSHCNGVSKVDDSACNISSDETGASYSESGTRTPDSLEDLTPRARSGSCLTALEVAPPPKAHTQFQRLNSKAVAFTSQQAIFSSKKVQPRMPYQAHGVEYFEKHIAEVIRLAKVAINRSQAVKDVEIFADEGGWSVSIHPKVIEQDCWQIELLVTLAKEAILDAAATSKCIYVMGYSGPQPFDMQAQGFRATLGAMQNASAACWHVFKKGFCRHGKDCCKQHPVRQVPVQVVVEGVQCQSCTPLGMHFNEQSAELALAATSILGDNPHIELVEAFKNQNYQGWEIQLTAKEHMAVPKDYLLTLAKNALFASSSNSQLLYIIGYASKPFMRKERGFMALLGGMQDDSSVSWDVYSNASCNRKSECRWEHPECIMPINITVMEKHFN